MADSIREQSARKNLVFLTSGFPYGCGETFIENELPFLASSFEKVFILVPAEVVNQEKRPVSENVIILPVKKNFGFTRRFIALLRHSFWQGFLLDLQRKNRGAGFFRVFQNCWHYYTQALQVKRAIQETILHNEIKGKNTILYSYWLDEKALGIGLVKEANPETKAISRAHGWDVFEERHQFPFLPFRPWLFKTLDKVAVVSIKGADYLTQKFDLQEGKVVVSYLGTERINEKSKENNEKYSIVSCSSLIPLKRVELIIEALSFLDFPLNWTHIGDGPMRKELEERAAISFEGKDIEYRFLGHLINKQVRDIYENSFFDLFISTSETEGLPVSMMEAQSAGIPILATDVGGVNEVVKNEITGWLVSPNPSSEEIAEKIKKAVLQDRFYIEKMKNDCKKHWNENFNASKNYPIFLDLINP